VVQHLPANSRNLLPKLLARDTRLRVKLAEAGERPQRGTVHVAPADHHLLVTPDGRLASSQAERENFCRPAVDVLLRSLAEAHGARAIGIVLTCMGRDGAHGLAAIRAAGRLTIAQDDATAEAPGMPSAAIDLGRAELALAPPRIAAALQVSVQPTEADAGISARITSRAGS
jgi:two-component system chemotaxis response regulator CheB